MSVIAIAPKHNAKGKKDADEFQREANKFVKRYDGQVFLFDNSLEFDKRRAQVQRFLHKAASPANSYKLHFSVEDVESIGFFCHGWRNGIQAGYKIQHAQMLGKALSRYDPYSIALYCCSVAAGPDAGNGSFASVLARNTEGIPVYGHDRKGHTARNPHVWCYVGKVGGYRPIARDSDLWSDWVKALKGEYRFDYPLATQNCVSPHEHNPWEHAEDLKAYLAPY